jgi:hypothetical protein
MMTPPIAGEDDDAIPATRGAERPSPSRGRMKRDESKEFAPTPPATHPMGGLPLIPSCVQRIATTRDAPFAERRETL